MLIIPKIFTLLNNYPLVALYYKQQLTDEENIFVFFARCFNRGTLVL